MSSADYRELLPLKGHVMDDRGQYYVINKRERKRDGRSLTAQITCAHVLYKLADYKFPYASYITEAYGVHISTLTGRIETATGGRFTISVDDDFALNDVRDFVRGNCLEALNAILTLYGAEIEPDNFTLHIRKKVGNPASDLQYRYAKNIVNSAFADDGASLCTRLFAEMKDSRTWIGQPASILTPAERARLEAIPGAIVGGNIAVNYLISPDAGVWASDSVPYYDDTFSAQDVTDPLKLLEAARQRLTERSAPLVEVSVSAADLHKIDATEPQPGLGDTVTLVDVDMGLDYATARITELTEFPYAKDRNAQVTVANVMRRDYAQIIADLESGRKTVEDAFSGGRIRAAVFEEFARAAVVDVNASKTQVKYDTRGIVLQSLVDANDQVIMTSNGIIVTTDGGLTARSAITATGIVAEQVFGQLGSFVSLVIGSGNAITKINTSGISAGHADFASAPFSVDMAGHMRATDGYFTGNITGSTITGSTLQTAVSGPRWVADTTGWRSFDGSGVERVALTIGTSSEMNAIRWRGSSGNSVGTISGVDGTWLLVGIQDVLLQAGFGVLNINGRVNFGGNVTGLPMSSISGLLETINALWVAIAGSSGA
jgi:hypothetical protein